MKSVQPRSRSWVASRTTTCGHQPVEDVDPAVEGRPRRWYSRLTAGWPSPWPKRPCGTPARGRILQWQPGGEPHVIRWLIRAVGFVAASLGLSILASELFGTALESGSGSSIGGSVFCRRIRRERWREEWRCRRPAHGPWVRPRLPLGATIHLSAMGLRDSGTLQDGVDPKSLVVSYGWKAGALNSRPHGPSYGLSDRVAHGLRRWAVYGLSYGLARGALRTAFQRWSQECCHGCSPQVSKRSTC